MSPFHCLGCGAPIIKDWNGPDPKWCSEWCRKQSYAANCEECGAPTNGSNGRGPNAARICGACNSARLAAEAVEFGRLRAEDLLAMWNAGARRSDIARIFHVKPATVSSTIGRLRGRGYPFQVRRPDSQARLLSIWRGEAAR